jgi:hypothetical protein
MRLEVRVPVLAEKPEAVRKHHREPRPRVESDVEGGVLEVVEAHSEVGEVGARCGEREARPDRRVRLDPAARKLLGIAERQAQHEQRRHRRRPHVYLREVGVFERPVVREVEAHSQEAGCDLFELEPVTAADAQRRTRLQSKSRFSG